MNTLLRKCPFCNGKAKLTFEYIAGNEKCRWYAQAQCTECFATAKGEWSELLVEAKEKAIEKWNRRIEFEN